MHFTFIGEYDAMAVCQGLKFATSKIEEVAVSGTVPPDSDVTTKKKTKKPKKGEILEVYQGQPFGDGDIPAISLPNGCNSLPVELIPLLERFSKVYLWLDNDKSGKRTSSYLDYHRSVSAYSEFSSFHNMINFPAFCLSVCLSIYEHICVSMRASIYNVISIFEKHKITRVQYI